MPKFVYPFLLPLGVLVALIAMIAIIAVLYFTGDAYLGLGHNGSVVVGLVLTVAIGIGCYLVERRGGPRTAGH